MITGAHPEYASAALLDALDAHLEARRQPRLPRRQRAQRQRLGRPRPPARDRAAPRRDPGPDLAGAARASTITPRASTAATGAGAAGPSTGRSASGSAASATAPATAYERVRDRRSRRRRSSSRASSRKRRSTPHGAVLGGAAGFEVDGHDPRARLAARGRRPGDARPRPRATSVAGRRRRRPRRRRPPLRADMVVRRRPEGGAVFSVGSIAWTGCLAADDDNPVSRVTENALAELAARARRSGRGRWLSRRSPRAARALRRRSSSAPATTASSPRPTSPGPACGRWCVERREIVGGACTTEEFAPGFRASPGAYVLSLLRPAIWRDFALRAPRARGARGGADPERVPRRRPAHPPRRRPRDRARAGALRPRRRRRLRRASAPSWSRSRGCSGPGSTGSPPGAPRLARPRLAAGARPQRSAPSAATGSQRRSCSRPRPATTSSSASPPSTSARRSAGTRSRTRSPGPRRPGPPTRCCTSTPPPRSAGSPGASSAAAWATVTALLADAAAEAGAEIVTGAPVERILVDDGRAAGVAARRGARDRRRRGALERRPEADPARARRPRPARPRTAAAIEAYRCEGASLKINLAVGELPRIEGTPAGLQPHHRGLVQLTLPLAEMDADQEGARRGIPAPSPARRALRAERARPSLAPAGRHVVTLGFRSQPYRLAESDWDAERERVADRLIDELATMIPNLAGIGDRRARCSPRSTSSAPWR